MKINPISNHIFIEVGEKVERKSGIILAKGTDTGETTIGKVVAVGPGKMMGGNLIPLEVNVGDRIIFEKYAPEEIEFDGKKYLVAEEDSIIAILE